MGDILIRDLDPDVARRLKVKARRAGHSVATEIKAILDDATRYSRDEFLELVDGWQAEDLGTPEDPTLIVREARAR
ncbi:MAG: hypothetical protein Q7W30_07595 [Coriobacteriia bacterium]|nr:hypothetical protein [Coriobacteriia bacterium]